MLTICEAGIKQNLKLVSCMINIIVAITIVFIVILVHLCFFLSS